MTSRPVIGLTADVKQIDPHPFHCVGDKYLRAVADAAAATPVILPALGAVDMAELAAMVDGILFTGSYANIHPSRYDGGEPYTGSPVDLDRDNSTLALIPAAISFGLPIFGVCRGFQEMNVALGGSLHQKVHEVPGLNNHREDPDADLDVQYGPAHSIQLEPEGQLAAIAGGLTQQVNSLHGQGVDRLADGVRVEARAEDGLVEAFSVSHASAFALAVQWHPEWKPLESPFYAALWKAFGNACLRYRARRNTTNKVA